MPTEFSIIDLLKKQLCVKLPIPQLKFTGQTIIVTGANSGMGLEAARHFIRLDAAKVILAVRSLSKGEAAADDIRTSTGCRPDAVAVWQVDLESASSVQAFAKRVHTELDRLDVFLANAGIYCWDYHEVDGNERIITVNVVNTLLSGILVIPKLRETSVKFKKETVLNFNGSFVHFMTEFPERQSEDIFGALRVKERARMNDRYNVSKMIQLLLVRELAAAVATSNKTGNVIVSVLNPGFVATNLMHEAGTVVQFLLGIMYKLISRTQEQGGRILVNAAEGGWETHGQYLSECKVTQPSMFVRSEEGAKTQKRLWEELMGMLEARSPGIAQCF